MKTIIFLALMLAFTSFSHQANPAGAKPKTAVKAKVHVAKATPIAKAAIKKLKVVAGSVKPTVKTQVKAGKHKAGPSKAQLLAKKKKDEHNKDVKVATIISNKKNIKLQQDLSKDRDEMKAELKANRKTMRAQRKIRDDAKLKQNTKAFLAAKHKVNEAKDKMQAHKIMLKKYVHKLKKVGAKLLKNKLTLQKVTGKKADSNSRKPHDINRLEQNIAVIMNRKEKIFNLANRLARNMVFLDYAKTQKTQKAKVFRAQLAKRIGRLTKRVARKQKELFRVLKRKHRIRPNFKTIFKRFADKAYKLAKAETPKKMTKEQSVHVENLKKKIMELQKKHISLVGQKDTARVKIRKAKNKIAVKKDEKKADKKAAAEKKQAGSTKKPSKAEKKEAQKKAFKLDKAKTKAKAAKENRHNLRQEDRKVMNKIHAMGAEIKKISGQKFHRPSILASTPAPRIAEIEKRKQNKVKRAQKKIAKIDKKLKMARAEHNEKKAIKFEAKAKKASIQLLKRTARLASFKEKKLENPQVKKQAKLKKKEEEKKNKYKD